MNIFKLNRIKFDEMAQDVQTFLTEMYEASGRSFSSASPWGQIIKVIINLAQLMFYYIEDAITELNINTASRATSVYGISTLTGHDPLRAMAASGTVRLVYNGTELENRGSQIVIPNYTRVKAEANGLSYTLSLAQDEIRINARPNQSAVISVLQGTMESQVATGTGLPLQTVNFVVKGFTDQQFVNVYVNNERYTVYQSLYDIPRGAKGCLVRTSIPGNGITVSFGTENIGFMPPAGAEIRVEYLITQGRAGNLRNNGNVRFTFSDTGFDESGRDIDLGTYLDVRIETPIIFGADPEPVELTRLLAPRMSRSMVLATPDNYNTFLERLNYFSVVDTFTTFDDDFIDDDNVIYIFLIPDIRNRLIGDENYFSVPQGQFALTTDEKTRVYDLIEDSGSMIVTTIVRILDPEIRRYVMNISLTTYEGYAKEIIRAEIINKLSNYFLTNRRRDRIPKSDFIGIIEGIAGVDSVNVYFVSEENEKALAADPSAAQVGLDEFGDIVIGRGELPIIRGGWADRNGLIYEDTIDYDGRSIPCSVNIEFKRTVPKSYNAEMHRINMNKIKRS